MKNPTMNLSLAAAFLATPWLAAQDSAPNGNLAQQLQAAYQPTVMDASGIKVAQPGTILVVKKEGIQANPPKIGYYGNDYADGKVNAGALSSAVDSVKDRAKGILGNPLGRKVDRRVDSVALAVDDKVYLTKMEIKPASIDFYIQSCGSCDPAAADPAHHPHLAKVSVKLVSGFINKTDFNHLQQSIGEIFAVPDGGGEEAQDQPQPQPQEDAAVQPAPAGQESAPAQPPERFADIAPPEPPPAEPPHIQRGQSPEQVAAMLGNPRKIVDLDDKQIYIYKDLKVTFVKEKVVNFVNVE